MATGTTSTTDGIADAREKGSPRRGGPFAFSAGADTNGTVSQQRPFRILGVQQIAIGGPSKDPLRALWIELLGAELVGSFRNEADNVDEDVVSIGEGVGFVEIDLMQPIAPGREPKVDEPALNHIGLWVDNLEAAVAWLGARGVRLAPGRPRGAAGYDTCYIEPNGGPGAPQGGEGVRIELVQAPTEVIDALDEMTRSRMTFVPDMPK